MERTQRARAIGAGLGKSGRGSEQVGILFLLLDDDGNQSGRMTYYGSFSDKAFDITLKAMRTAGWTGTNLDDLSSLGDGNTPEVSLVIENEEYNGVTRPKIKWVNAGGLAMKDQLEPSEAQSFAAKMRGAVLAYDQKNPGAKRTTNTARPTPSSRNSSPPPSGPPEPPPLTDDPPF